MKQNLRYISYFETHNYENGKWYSVKEPIPLICLSGRSVFSPYLLVTTKSPRGLVVRYASMTVNVKTPNRIYIKKYGEHWSNDEKITYWMIHPNAAKES